MHYDTFRVSSYIHLAKRTINRNKKRSFEQENVILVEEEEAPTVGCGSQGVMVLEKARWIATTPRRRRNDRPLLNTRDCTHGTWWFSARCITYCTERSGSRSRLGCQPTVSRPKERGTREESMQRWEIIDGWIREGYEMSVSLYFVLGWLFRCVGDI